MGEVNATLASAIDRLERDASLALAGVSPAAMHAIGELRKDADMTHEASNARGSAALTELRALAVESASGNGYYRLVQSLDEVGFLFAAPNSSASPRNFEELAGLSSARVEEVRAGLRGSVLGETQTVADQMEVARKPADTALPAQVVEEVMHPVTLHADIADQLRTPDGNASDGELRRRSETPPDAMEPATLPPEFVSVAEIAQISPDLGLASAPGTFGLAGLVIQQAETGKTATVTPRETPANHAAPPAVSLVKPSAPQRSLFDMWLDVMFGPKR